MSITLLDTINAVNENKLSRDKNLLEQYHTDLSQFFAEMKIETADLEKKEAIFLYGKTEDDSVANRKNAWKATAEGQRLIELDNYCLAVKTLLGSIKSRLYSIY